jgi:HK97 family phage portal protein
VAADPVSLFFKRAGSTDATAYVTQRSVGAKGSARSVKRDEALRHSAIWAGLRLRADLISTMPVDVFRRVNGIQVETAKPSVLESPAGPGTSYVEWAYSTQVDLDSAGNTVGIVRARDSFGLPSVIEPVCIDDVVVRSLKGAVTYSISGKTYQPSELWHERQYTVSGVPVGLSPIAYAAMSINGHLSAQEFAAGWFGNSAVPASHLRNTAKTLTPTEAQGVKDRFKASVSSGDVFVTGNDWEYSMLAAKASESSFIEQMSFSINDAARFIGVPGDLIDAPAGGSSITYANITQRHLQLLIINLGPAIVRREDAFSRLLLPRPRYAKLNPGALLRMDQQSRYESYEVGIRSRFLPPSEVRDLENLPPLTPEQEAEFARLFPAKQTPQGAQA